MMDRLVFEEIGREIAPALAGRRYGRAFQLSRFEFIFDLRLSGSRYLLINIDPAEPRTYLARRKLREIEKASVKPGPFVQNINARLFDTAVLTVTILADSDVILIDFEPADTADTVGGNSLAVTMTGRSANILLLDNESNVVMVARESGNEGQCVGDRFAPPKRKEPDEPSSPPSDPGDLLTGDTAASLSERLDGYYQKRAAVAKFNKLGALASSKIEKEIKKKRKLLENLDQDLRDHGDAETWKRFGELLLANVRNAVRESNAFVVTDLFDPGQPLIRIEAVNDDSITETAEKYFRKYAKSRNAAIEISKRRAAVLSDVARLESTKATIGKAIEESDEETLERYVNPAKREPAIASKGKAAGTNSGVRKFISSDGFEILVGKKAKDNDQLTFRIAKSLDTWMHAADYPGSHVVIRNPGRSIIPPKTLLEAAQIAAFYSQGNKQPKAAVHYTQKKFVNKPKGAAPGLVSLASFKTILVEPKISLKLELPTR